MNALTLTISNTPIKQDADGRFCLNDFHKAAGNENKHRPSLWLRSQQTVDLIEEIVRAQIPALEQNQPVKTVNGGNQQGTFVVKELVYAYAMWISPAFSLKVIRTFDALVAVQPPTNVPLRDYVELQTKHDAMQAELLDLYRYKIAALESQLEKPTRSPTTPLTADEKAEIVRLHGLGHSRTEIVELTGRSDTSVYYVLRHALTDAQGGMR